ncbi:hypothetical protein B0X71_02510 [Planococcus lenghuensis]|uniref:DUF4064 domain-containing protein n=2 Tax=Planococcus lenghuensis TaxID=2213202 RepID=A0A1Q2L3C4_9BACL|nr:hypothetical protein B0X71_02510 [Planococcus lenghuensis]
MYQSTFSRTGEKVLGIIGIVLNVIAIILVVMAVVEVGSGTFEADLEEFILTDPTLAPEDAEATLVALSGLTEAIEVFGWVIGISLVVSTILAIIAVINLNDNKKPVLAGVLFVIAGILSGIISLTALIFYIAAIMCFVRKPPLEDEQMIRVDEPVEIETQDEDDSPYRPL